MPDSPDINDLSAYGATPESVIDIGLSVDHRHLDYLDLSELPEQIPRVTSVVEMAGRPVLYVVRGPLSVESLEATCHLLAQRGAADHLGIVEPGILRVVPLLRNATSRKKPSMVWHANDRTSHERLPGLAFGIMDSPASGTAKCLHDELVNLLTNATTKIVAAGVELPEDALSLVGRALFLRFLIDRHIIGQPDVDYVCPGAGNIMYAMSSPEHIGATSEWLNTTFNGNLLPLSSKSLLWSRVSNTKTVCEELTKILLKSEGTGQLRFDWASLDFGHIPVGLLSQVYEKWCHVFSRKKAILNSVWYTPRSIAEYLVGEVFYGLEEPHSAKILDPAVGAGVFLVAVYRELVAARWRHDRSRPDRNVLRDILYNQLSGFDVNEASLRLTALALYLTALELDPEPHPDPLTRLKFKDLREEGVLQDVCGPLDDVSCAELPMVGSLGPHIDPRHKGAYDVVLGNPPWTAWTSATGSSDERVKKRRALVEDTITPIVSARLDEHDARFDMVDFAPDLAFCWRAMEWARPGGTLAFALHTRLLFRQSEPGIDARNKLFGAVSISGILNGAALAQTNVWPSHEAPFCLLFATNNCPLPSDGFHFVSPVVDDTLNSQGHLRVDASASRIVYQHQVKQQPWLLKTLYRGTPLDAEVMGRLMRPGHSSLGKYFIEILGRKPSRGYVEGAERSIKRDAVHLHELRDLKSHNDPIPFVDVAQLKKFKPRKVNTGRSPEVFRGPLVLLFEAPRHDRGLARAILCKEDVAFNHVFFGFSTATHRSPQLFADYLLVLLNSSMVLYVALMRSLQFGADRKRFDQSDLLALPLWPIESLSREMQQRVRRLAKRVIASPCLPEEDIDALIGEIYGLSHWDMEVVRDTLSVSLPFKTAKDLAQARPTGEQISAFMARVKDLIGQVLSHVDRDLEVVVLPPNNSSPWIFLSLRTWKRGVPPPHMPEIPSDLLRHSIGIATDSGASQIIVTESRCRLIVGIFAQYRYWTLTQGRLLALELLGNPTYEESLRGEGK